MKITQAGSGAPAGRSRKSGKTGSAEASQAFSNHLNAGETPESSPTTGAQPLAALSSLLAVQEVPDATTGKKRAILYGDSLLDELKELQIGLVQGWVGEDQLRTLAHMLDRPRPPIDDLELKQVLDDIELRAAVELAKLERSST